MNSLSLKLRLLLAGGLALLVALTLTGLVLTWLFQRHVERRLGHELNTFITQIASRLSFAADGTPQLTGRLADPRFERIYSGLYWQIENETADKVAHSRSLWDVHLQLPDDLPPFGKLDSHIVRGPEKTRLLAHERRLRFPSARGEQVARVVVAVDRAELERNSQQFASDTAIALLALGLFLLAAGWVQITIGLQPLKEVRRVIADIRSGRTNRVPDDWPREIAPLGEELNSLLEAQEKSLERARHRAADLAHGFKTPLTALASDVRRLREKGEDEIARDIAQTAQAMRRQIERELTRARPRNLSRQSAVLLCDIVRGIAQTLRRTPDGSRKELEIDCPAGLSVQIDRDDLADILGNLLENGLRHAGTRVRLSARREAGRLVRIIVEDDGPGISRQLRGRARERGVRLDEAASGSGLGLAIVSDLLDIHGQTLELAGSPLGGLRASFRLPESPEANN